MLLYSVPNLWVWYVHEVEPITAPFILPITQIAMTGSVYSVVAVAVERYFNICKPFVANWVRLPGQQSADLTSDHFSAECIKDLATLVIILFSFS